jgi:molybdate transport system ATP-binding protein
MTGLHVDLVTSRDAFEVAVKLDAAPGKVTALLGPNGAGKSTVVDAIVGLMPIDSGAIRLGDVALDEPATGSFVPARERNIGVVFQDRALFPHLSAVENVAFGLVANGLSRDEATDRARRLLDDIGLVHIAERNAPDLSGGEAQRVAIARALAIEPDALVLDEPLSALDATSRVGVRRMLADHADVFTGPVLLITHDPTEAFILADQICVMERGHLTQVGVADDIRLRPRTRYIADLAGVNLVTGPISNGVLSVGDHDLHVADRTMSGVGMATIEPRAISVHLRRPEGSQRNIWETTIDRVEHHGDRVRLHAGAPLPITVEVTPGAVEALGLSVGSAIWLAIKATEIGIQPA